MTSDDPLSSEAPPAEKKRKFPPLRLIAVAVVAILTLVLVLQNKEPVETKLLFATVVMPRAVLLGATFALGMVAGLLLAWVRKRAKD